MEQAPIGMFDSGLGGLSVLREIRSLLPQECFLYVADQGHVPYGPRPLEEVRRFCFGIAAFLLVRRVKMIVVACNAASAAALQPLRKAYPRLSFVGMEPAVKPAVAETRRGVIGVIATPATFQGELFASVVMRHARGVRLVTQTCPGLVEMIEAGETEGPALESMLRAQLQPLVSAGIDELVLGCTHYPFVRPLLQKVLGPGVKIIDPAPAVARQVKRLLARKRAIQDSGPGGTDFYTSGDPDAFSKTIFHLLGEETVAHQVIWSEREAGGCTLTEA
jgi:glutamate racemase